MRRSPAVRNSQPSSLFTTSRGPLTAPHGDVRKPPVPVAFRWHARSVTETLDPERCYRAVAGRDARFDGWFFTAVHTTGIYCRPSCPARTPLARNVSFFTTAAAAQAAGFRACRRCRPDAVPGSPEWDVRADVVARAMRLITDGEVERSGVPGLAARLGYSERQGAPPGPPARPAGPAPPGGGAPPVGGGGPGGAPRPGPRPRRAQPPGVLI